MSMVHPAVVRIAFLTIVLAGVTAPTRAQQPTAFVGGTLIDGTGSPPVNDAVVVISEGRIVCAGSRAFCTVTPNTATVDVRNRWIMPGIVDAHVHYSQTGWAPSIAISSGNGSGASNRRACTNA